MIETGIHSPWVSRLLEKLGMKVLIRNARKLRMIWDDTKKSDVRDAEMLAGIGRFDPQLLCPIRHSGEQAQVDLELIRGREVMVSSRTKVVNHVRGAVKSMACRIPKCSTDCFHRRTRESLRDTERMRKHVRLHPLSVSPVRSSESDERVRDILI